MTGTGVTQQHSKPAFERESMHRFLGKRVLVTGSGRGIGAAIARHFTLEGARVHLTARGNEKSGEIWGQTGRSLISTSIFAENWATSRLSPGFPGSRFWVLGLIASGKSELQRLTRDVVRYSYYGDEGFDQRAGRSSGPNSPPLGHSRRGPAGRPYRGGTHRADPAPEARAHGSYRA